jgi:hypothetical protein
MLPLPNDGVDITLIRWMLSLTPSGRLQTLQDFVDGVEEIRKSKPDAQLPGGFPRLK